MKLKNFAAAAVLSISTAAAFAGPLSSVGGFTEWKLTGLTTESANAAGSNETTWGIGTINSLTYGINNQWSSGEGGQYLNYVIYGIADLSVTPGSPYANNIYNYGATGGAGDGYIHLDIYLSNSAYNFNGASTANRSGF